MARIRSIHPGIFTDEAFMTASAHARLLIMGIWCEAWDDGVFEWKPLTLKARLFPVDNVDVAGLLGELSTLDFVQKFDVVGKPFGVIRNFQKYQRPKKPNSSGVMPEHLKDYAGAVRNQFGTGTENSPQMEDGGGVGGEEEIEDTASAASSASAPPFDLEEAERRCREASGSDTLGSFAPIAELIHRQADLDRDILPVIRSRPANSHGIKSWRYYAPIIAEGMAKRAPPIAKPGREQVFIARDSPDWGTYCRAAGHTPSLTTQNQKTKVEGWWFDPPAPPQQKDQAA